MPRSRVPLSEIVAAYRETGSVWKAGKLLGLSGQTIHERLRANDIQLPGQKWSEEEDAEMAALVSSSLTIGQIAARLGRTYAGVACRMHEKGITKGKGKAKKIPRGSGYDKVSVGKHLSAIEKSDIPITRYCKANSLSIEMVVRATQAHFPERWAAYKAKHGGPPQKECLYCKTLFHPANGKQGYCDRKCSDRARVDASYFGGKRRTTIGLEEGVCQLCGRAGERGLSSHHVLGKENDPENDNLIALCQGCHQIVTITAARTFTDDPSAWESLISLAWLRKHGKDIATFKDGSSVRVYVEIEIEESEDD